jgi:hypothetical protein
MLPGAETHSTRQGSTTNPEGESEGESQRVLLGDKDVIVEITAISTPSSAIACQCYCTIRCEALFPSPVPDSKEEDSAVAKISSFGEGRSV